MIANISKEFLGADLGDARRDARVVKIAEAIAARPAESLPKALVTEAALEASYRLLENEDVGARALIAPHIRATLERCRTQTRVYAVSDTTEFTFSGDERREGLGALANNRQGFMAHFAIAVGGDGARRPLGLLGWNTWVRADESREKTTTKQQRRKDPSRESKKWRDVAQSAQAELHAHPCVIHVMDREADIYDLLSWLREEMMRFVIRVKSDRKLAKDEKMDSLFAGLSQSEEIFQQEVPVGARAFGNKHPHRTGRNATLRFASSTLTVQRPKTAKVGSPKTLTLNFVHITEPNPPAGEVAIDWKLMTSEPVATAHEVASVVEAYRARWTVEEFFKAIKTGCAYEQSQLESKHTLTNYLAILLPIAWQLLLIRNHGRDEPSRPAREILTLLEIRVLIAMCPDRLPPEPTIAQAMQGIARLGGHIKNNGPAGWQVLGRGYEDLCRFVQAWQAAKLAPTCDQS